jgi:raffinose/stachyose/melibiose transport system permease protein
LLTVTTVIFQSVIGLLLALALNTNIKSRNYLRAVFFAPVVLTPLILAYVWQYIYSQGGVLNQILALIGLEELQQNWLGNSSVALWSIVGLLIWQYSGFSMVIFLSGLQGIPQELYEAAEVDGAGTLQRFWNITLPMLAPVTTIAVVLATIIHLRIFDQVLAMTYGGPGYATETLSTLLYKQAFVFGNYAQSMATALVLTMIVCAVALVQLKVLRSREEEA